MMTALKVDSFISVIIIYLNKAFLNLPSAVLHYASSNETLNRAEMLRGIN